MTLADCDKTTVKNDLLEALFINKRRVEAYQHINPVLSGGHPVKKEARQILSWLFRAAFGIVRLPGFYDIKLQSKYFENLELPEIDAAIKEIKRIYEFSQQEMSRVLTDKKIPLVRGIRYPESIAVGIIFKEMETDIIPYHMQTFSFFNHINNPFDGDITIYIHFPIEWVWASGYTLENIYNGTDEEFFVICQSVDGKIDVHKDQIKLAEGFDHEITKKDKINIFTPNPRQSYLEYAFSLICEKGFEPNDLKCLKIQFDNRHPGPFENRLSALGRKLDSKFFPDRKGVVKIY